MNKIVAKDSLRVTSQKNYRGREVTHSVTIKKDFITGIDVADALVKCECILRKQTWADPDHCFFEGFLGARPGAEELICYRWGS